MHDLLFNLTVVLIEIFSHIDLPGTHSVNIAINCYRLTAPNLCPLDFIYLIGAILNCDLYI